MNINNNNNNTNNNAYPPQYYNLRYAKQYKNPQYNNQQYNNLQYYNGQYQQYPVSYQTGPTPYNGAQPMNGAYVQPTPLSTYNYQNPMAAAQPMNRAGPYSSSSIPNQYPAYQAINSTNQPPKPYSSAEPLSNATNTSNELNGSNISNTTNSTNTTNTSALPSASSPQAIRQNEPPKPQYNIPPSQKSRYSNLYGLIAAIETLEEEYCDGNIDKKEHAIIFTELQQQFLTLQSALNLSKDDIKHFCDVFKIPCGFTLSLVFKTDSSSNNRNIQEGIALGTDFTTLSDLCYLKTQPASSFLSLARQIKQRLMSMNVYNNALHSDVQMYTDKWIKKLEAIDQSQAVPDNIIDELQKDINFWKSASIEAMS